MPHLLDHPVLSQRYFFPRDERPRTPWMVETGGERLACIRAAKHGKAMVLHFHGNGEVASDWEGDFSAAALDAAGIDLVLGEYRGYGGSTGRPMLETMLDDALAIADATGVRPEDLVVYGRSIGSLYALHVAAHRPVKALVLESGIADVMERLALRVTSADVGTTEETFRAEVARAFDHEAKIARTKCPVLVLHTKNDGMVEAHHAKALAGWAGARAELLLFENGNHNTIHVFNGPDILRRVVGYAST